MNIRISRLILTAALCLLLFPFVLSGLQYTVEEGDSLWGIARKYSVSVQKIQEFNDLGNSTILPGTILKIPAGKEKGSAEKRRAVWYTVEKGDSLWYLARKFNISQKKLKEMNDLSSSVLFRGQKLKVPAASGTRSDNSGQGRPESPQWVSYSVKGGESLWGLARRHHTDIKTLVRKNGLKRKQLYKGQRILVPKLSGNKSGGGGSSKNSKQVSEEKQTHWKKGGKYFGKIPASRRPSFSWPVRGKVVERFGVKSRWINNGITIKTPKEWAVRAANSGRVTFSGRRRGYGKMVIIRHSNNIYTVYTNLSRLYVKKNERVDAGERIGGTGWVESAGTNGVHFQVYYKTKPVNPLEYL